MIFFFVFSDKSSKWKQIDEETKKRLQVEKKNDGEFWMSFDDYILSFDTLSLIHVNLNAFTEQQQVSSSSLTHWDFKQYSGKWKALKKSIKDHKKSFWSNPQHVINLSDANRLKQMIVALMSTDYIERRKRDEDYASIAFHLFKVKGNNSKIKANYDSEELQRIGKSNNNGYYRDTTKRFTVKKGLIN